MTTQNVGLIGIGSMGWPMGARIRQAGFGLAAIDAVAGRAAEFAKATGATAASMVAELGAERPVIAWCAQTTPCTSVFLPVAVGAELPDALTRGTGEPERASAWWLMKALGDAVMGDPVVRTPVVQHVWHGW